MTDEKKTNKVVLQRVQRDGTTGLAIDEKYIVLEDTKLDAPELLKHADKWINDKEAKQ